jgi:hypothetical protein
MKYEDLKIGLEFSFMENKENTKYDITSVHEVSIDYKASCGTHSFACFMITEEFLKRTQLFKEDEVCDCCNQVLEN